MKRELREKIEARYNMGRIDVILPDDLEEEFRMQVATELGMRRGNLTKAMEQAVTMWIKSQRNRRSEMGKKVRENRRTNREVK